jgi:hypothetical protein
LLQVAAVLLSYFLAAAIARSCGSDINDEDVNNNKGAVGRERRDPSRHQRAMVFWVLVDLHAQGLAFFIMTTPIGCDLVVLLVLLVLLVVAWVLYQKQKTILREDGLYAVEQKWNVW